MFIFLLTWAWVGLVKPILASENIACNNRYATIVDPVRSINLWKDRTLEPIKQQYKLIGEKKFRPLGWYFYGLAS